LKENCLTLEKMRVAIKVEDGFGKYKKIGNGFCFGELSS